MFIFIESLRRFGSAAYYFEPCWMTTNGSSCTITTLFLLHTKLTPPSCQPQTQIRNCHPRDVPLTPEPCAPTDLHHFLPWEFLSTDVNQTSLHSPTVLPQPSKLTSSLPLQEAPPKILIYPSTSPIQMQERQVRCFVLRHWHPMRAVSMAASSILVRYARIFT